MNQSDPSCHQIPNFPHLFVDAFRTHRHKTTSSLNAFVLTHYHSDHYGGLPQDGLYEGPACVHCTPVTAALLRDVHGVRAGFVVEHGYGETWTWPPPHSRPSTASANGTADPANGGDGAKVEADRKGGDEAEGTVLAAGTKDETSSSTVSAEVTFYDANHCPGAAIVLIKLVTTSRGRGHGPRQTTTYHLHTGDMRYHPKMRDYPLLREAALGRRLDRLYLDTTYAHPKHDFVPQDVAVETIASAVEGLLKPEVSHDTDTHETAPCSAEASEQPITAAASASPSRSRTLVLLSCYTIGKEKVLHSSAKRSGQPLYVTDKKLRMLRCVGRGRDGRDEESCNDVIDMCTTDPNSSDLHVVPMGRAGELWPYFRPNYNACARYAQKLERRYDRVVAFIPTGWADASNWNRKNAVCRRTVSLEGSGEQNEDEEAKIEVEVRLIAYSEHSSFSELEDFVYFVKPRKVVPTVYSNEKDKRAIEKRFEKFVDGRRAKRSFVDFINSAAPAASRNKGLHDGNGSMKSFPRGFSGLRCVSGASSSSLSSKSSSSTSGGDKTCSFIKKGAVLGGKSDLPGGEISDDDFGGSTMEVSVVDMTGDEDIEDDGDASEVCKPQPLCSLPPSDRGDSSPYGPNVATLLAMGFDLSSATEAVTHCGGDVERAVERLLVRGSAAHGCDGGDSRRERASTSSTSGHDKRTGNAQSDAKPKRGRSLSSSSPSSTITSYFQRKATH